MARDGEVHEHVYAWVNGIRVYKRTSPSQIKTYKLCPLKWWMEKIAHQQKKPDGKGVKLGKECHGREEHYLETGEDVRGAIEMAGAYLLEPFLKWAPFNYLVRNDTTDPDNTIRVASEARARAKEAAPLKVEESIGDLVTPGGVKLVGFADLMLPPGLISFPVLGQPPMENQAQVLDHKFKKNLAKYADTEKDLETDPQSIVYTKAALVRWPTSQSVRFAHHNHQTEGKKDAFARAVIFSAKEIEAKYSVLTDEIDSAMTEDCAKHSDRELKANVDACGAFGGCDFALVCPKSPRNRFLVQIPGVTRPGITLEVEKEKRSMGLIDAMNAAQNGAAAAQPQTGAPVTQTASAPAPQTGHTASADFIAAGSGVLDVLYFVASRIGKFKTASGGMAIFQGSDGSFFQTNAADPMKSAMTDPVALQAFGLIPAPQPAAAPATPAAPPARKMDGMPIVETINGVPTQVSGPPIPGLAQANLPVQGAGTAINPTPGNGAPNPEVKAAMEQALAAQQAAALGQAPAPSTTVTNVVNNAPAAGQAAPAATGTDAAGTTEKPKAKRGRPPGRKAAESVANGTAQAAGLSGLILVVNAAVAGDVDMDLADYVQDLHEMVCNSVTPALADVRLSDPKGPLGYGAWRGAMAAAALKSPPSGVCTIQRGDLADPVIEALSAVATLVIRGS